MVARGDREYDFGIVPTAESVAERYRGRDPVGGFDSASFRASVKGARVTAGGEMELTFLIPRVSKSEALAVTDAVGVMLEVSVTRVRRQKAPEDAE